MVIESGLLLPQACTLANLSVVKILINLKVGGENYIAESYIATMIYT